MFSSGTRVCVLAPLVFCRGSACTAVASCCGPRTAAHFHGAGRCDRPPWPSRTCRASCTPHKAGAPAGTACWPSAMQLCTHGWQRTAPPLGGEPCALRSTWCRRVPVPDSRDACTEPSVSPASAHQSPLGELLETTEAVDVLPGCLHHLAEGKVLPIMVVTDGTADL